MATPGEVARPSVAPRPMPPKFGGVPAKLPPPGAPPPGLGQAQNSNAGAGPNGLVSPRAVSVGGRPSFKLQIESEAPQEVMIDPRRPMKALIEKHLATRGSASLKTHVVRDASGNLLDISKTAAELNVFDIRLIPGSEADLEEAAALYGLEPSPSPRPLTQSSSDTNVSAAKDPAEPPSPRSSLNLSRPGPGPNPRPNMPQHQRISSAPGLVAPGTPPAGLRQSASANTTESNGAKRPPSSEMPAQNPGTPKRTVIPPANRPVSASYASNPSSVEGRIIAAEERMAVLEESMQQNSKLLEQILSLLHINE